ncbi:uncharacterized protein LOC100822227 [Brachypodium distachyon]|uniref:Bowman-Birk serine protease inhibitors family domain-containing protein n=1 Tax=Brachypodium distachyon TaxID=15368 RepID=I1HJ79_BRADI|nr:uncharacterized protein LOC100822227 [Brachypodium distachyon]KQK06152.1 hypothetical protein BRADI_2g24810v3 [Brachypodium distachyon]|eukprot:XP_003568411.1 uncharacterized protein LOC100822227 [Brachypodium distachyon]
MKSSTLTAILVLQAILVMGILAEVNAVGYWPKCCDNCRTFSGVMVCDDAMAKCHPNCLACRVVQEKPVKTFRCADQFTEDQTCGRKPCKHH